MRIAFFYLLLLAILSGCSIDDLEPNQSNTFLKFYYETNKMDSRDLAVLDDGYLLLSIFNDTTSLLLKTDLKGNKLWAKSLDNFKGSALAETEDGYIIIGNGINNQNASTLMKIIKTNKSDGNQINSTMIGDGYQHGTAVTLSSDGSIIATGYSTGNNNDSIIIAQYDNSLSVLSRRNYPHSSPSKSIYENNGLLSWLSYSNQTNGVNITEAFIDNETSKWDSPLFDGAITSDFNGDLTTTSTGLAIAQTLISGSETKIGITSYSNGTVTNPAILNDGEFAKGNYTAASIINKQNGLLVLATTDVHTKQGEEARNDVDLLLLELNYDGSIKTNGINETFGGLGDELPMRIRKTQDGGYAILGTAINTKGAQQTFLIKTDSKGQLN